MSQESTSEHGYRLGYSVCAIFLAGVVLATLAVVSDALHRSELEQVDSQVIPAPSPTPGSQ